MGKGDKARHIHCAARQFVARYGLRRLPSRDGRCELTDDGGRIYRVRTCVITDLDTATSFDFCPGDGPLGFDVLLGVFFAPHGAPLGAIKVRHDAVLQLGRANRDSFRLRWTRRTARDPRIERLDWPGAVPTINATAFPADGLR